jgi:hypothetical protein
MHAHEQTPIAIPASHSRQQRTSLLRPTSGSSKYTSLDRDRFRGDPIPVREFSFPYPL